MLEFGVGTLYSEIPVLMFCISMYINFRKCSIIYPMLIIMLGISRYGSYNNITVSTYSYDLSNSIIPNFKNYISYTNDLTYYKYVFPYYDVLTRYRYHINKENNAIIYHHTDEYSYYIDQYLVRLAKENNITSIVITTFNDISNKINYLGFTRIKNLDDFIQNTVDLWLVMNTPSSYYIYKKTIL